MKVRKKTVLRRWLRRLTEMRPGRIAYVNFGANHRVFAVVKEDTRMALHKGITLENIEKAHGLLAGLITVFKAGQLDDAAAKSAGSQLDAVADLILPPEEAEQSATLRSLSSTLRKDIEQLSTQAIATDYTLGDQVDSILEVAKQLEQHAATMEGAPDQAATEQVIEQTAAAAAATAAEDTAAATTADEAIAAAPTDTSTEEAAEEATEEGTEAATASAAGVEAAAAEETGATTATETEATATEAVPADGDAAAATGAEGDAAVATEANSDVVTKEWVEKAVGDAVKAGLAPLLEQITQVSKAATMPVAPTTSPEAGLRPPVAPQEPAMRQDAIENMDLTKSADLEHLDEYGRWTK